MNPVTHLLRNLRALFTQDFQSRWQAQEARLGAAERRADERATAYEAAVDARIEERFAAIEQRLSNAERRLDERLDAGERQLDERLDGIERQLGARLDAAEQRLDERAGAYETAVDARVESRFATIEQHLAERAGAYESALDGRIEERLASVEQQLDERVSQAEAAFDKQLNKSLKSLDSRFDKRARALDVRVDDRLAQNERHIDHRFDTLERRADARMETHERKVDGKIHQMANDIVDRTDLMLQIFEQRLDKLRRDLRALRDAVPPEAKEEKEPTEPPAAVAESVADPHQTLSAVISSANGAAAQSALDSQAQLISFRKLAANAADTRVKIAPADAPLYHKILAWKKIAQEGINEFTPDEEETIQYILSFIDDPKELAYVKQHLRRFISTLHRIPPARKTSDRLLELGSLFHLTAAIKKYCGYGEVCCADLWDSPEKVVTETLRQKNGPDSYRFELRNFDVECDPFPYPDGYFRTALCCELIEHLRRDPMHMLWECNRVLEMDGYLLLTTPNIVSCRAIEGLLVGCAPYLLSQYNLHEAADQHNREYAPYEVGIALAAAGFTVVELEAEDVWMRSNPAIIELLKQVQISTELRGDNIFALARKTGAPVERYPKELYIE